MGKLIVIEGLDGSGKSTQYDLLNAKLQKENVKFRFLKFPRYEENSSYFVREYLNGNLGFRPDDINAYAASSFFAMDRYISYKKHWGEYYENGGVLLCDRYTTSNACHQGSKLPLPCREEFFHWLYEYEYVKLGLPKPDLVLFLHVPFDVIEKNLRERSTKRDIHENDREYLKKCGEAAEQAAEILGWQRVQCAEGGCMLPVETIHSVLYKKIRNILR